MYLKHTNDPTALRHTFHYQNDTHIYDIKWTALGDPNDPPLIFIHGTPWSSRVWQSCAIACSRNFRVFLFDSPGFGESPLERQIPGTTFDPPNKTIELDADLARQSQVFAALFKSWKKDWGHQRPHLVCHDIGGYMSLRANLLHGCDYASLCLIDVVAIGPYGQSLFEDVATRPEHFSKLTAPAFEDVVDMYIRKAAFSELPDHVIQMLKVPWLRKGGRSGFLRQLCQANSRSTHDLEGRYIEVGDRIPVKIIWGVNDEWIPLETAGRLATAIGTTDIVEIENAGHLIMYDAATQLCYELGSWLSRFHK
jgi:pimeloyl-ACP methyl ester carboxylesterase